MQAILLVIILVAVAYVMLSKPKNEGYVNSGLYDDLLLNRPGYVNQAQSKYNLFSDTHDVRAGDFYQKGPKDLPDPVALAQATNLMRDAMRSSDIVASGNIATGTARDVMAIESRNVPAPVNRMYEQTRTCEAVKTRDSCAKLGTPAFNNCGVCLGSGTGYADQSAGEGGHIGGMLALPDDLRRIEEAAKTNGTQPVYKPTVGTCKPGNFMVERSECVKQANRMDCLEQGAKGGFQNEMVKKKCAFVANSPTSLFVYEPKDTPRRFQPNLRVITPMGTGICQVIVSDVNANQVGFASSSTPGVEFIVPITGKPDGKGGYLGVAEADSLSVVVYLETTYRSGGKSETYLVNTDKKLTVADGTKLCQNFGGRLATQADLTTAQAAGAQLTIPGLTSDGFVGFPLNKSVTNVGNPGLIAYPGDVSGAWCYGIKPTDSLSPKRINTTVYPFFREATGAYAMNSQWGSDYKNAQVRGVILQWETGNNVSGQPVNATRTIAFKPTIIAVDHQVASDLGGGFSDIKILRDYGTFKGGLEIISPRPTGNSKILNGAKWLWSNSYLSQSVQFDVKVPGLFLDSYYSDDGPFTRTGPLISNASTMDLLKVGPCDAGDQTPGNYSLQCLRSLFVEAGGNVQNTKIPGGLISLNQKGSTDDITGYLINLVQIVQTGRDFTGNLVGQNPDERLQIINNASQILYGFDIISPCEDISEDTAGNVIIVPKSPPFNSDCLYYLWTNTGKEFDRGVIDQNGTADKRNIGNTYVTIGQRFSGLKKNEGPTQLLKDHPFRTCQLTGSLSPIKPNGQVNQDGVNYANSIGSVLDIQNNYNSIFTAANKPGNMGDEQTMAVKQCYGLNKSVRTLSAQANALDLSRRVGWQQLMSDPRSLKNLIPEGTKVALRVNSLYTENASAPRDAWANTNHPVWQSENYWYLSYNSDGKALWTKIILTNTYNHQKIR